MPDDLPIYMDNHATTRVDPRVVEAMLPFLNDDFGNPGSAHAWGLTAKEAVNKSRAAIAQSINADPAEIIFTSGATESNNLAIRGVAARERRRGDHLVSLRTEHEAVLEPLERFECQGYQVTLLDVLPYDDPRAGWIDPTNLAASLRDDTALVSVMLANNEIGVVHPLAKIADACRGRGIPLHCDATQAVGRIPVDVRALGIDLMSFTGHKIYGPKGVGALYVRGGRPAVRLEPQITGGGQQRGLRSGTLNVPGIVGLAKAVELCVEELPHEAERLAALRQRLWDGIQEQPFESRLCGPALDATDDQGQFLRIPGNLNVAFAGVDGEALMLQMKDLAVSTGAACATTDPSPSHVLRALGLTDDEARGTLRFGLGRFNTAGDVDRAVGAVSKAVRHLRQMG